MQGTLEVLRRFPQAPAGDAPDLMGRFTFEAGQVGGFCAASCGSSQHTLPVGLSPHSSRDVSTSTSLIRTRCLQINSRDPFVSPKKRAVLWQQGAAESRETAGHVNRRFNLLHEERKIKKERRGERERWE